MYNRSLNLVITKVKILAGKSWRPGDLIWPTSAVRGALIIIDVDQNAGVVSGVGTGEADKVLTRVGSRAGDANSCKLWLAVGIEEETREFTHWAHSM